MHKWHCAGTYNLPSPPPCSYYLFTDIHLFAHRTAFRASAASHSTNKSATMSVTRFGRPSAARHDFTFAVPWALVNTEIHPMVSEDKFPAHIDYYEVFYEPVKLVSRLLNTPQAIQYFLAIITKSDHISDLPDIAKHVQQRYQAQKDIRELDANDAELVHKWLCRIAKTFTFEVGACKDAWGTMQPLRSRYDPGCMLNARSVIRLSESDFFRPDVQFLSANEKLCRKFLLAVTIIHEIAHATLHALTEKSSEDFFEDSTIDDAGRELETRLFGLVPNVKLVGRNQPLLYWFAYRNRENSVEVAGIEDEFMEDLFSDRF